MNVQSKPYQPTFCARNLEIRRADKIMRNLMLEYPAFSTSRVKYYNIFKKHKKQTLNKTLPIYWRLSDMRGQLLKYHGVDFVNKTLEMVKREKSANCAEFATMASAAFLANGYKDVRLGSLRINYLKSGSMPSKTSEKADHRVLIVNAGKGAKLDNPSTFSKKAIIVDPWSGFCDYVSNAFNVYKGIFLRNLTPEKETASKKFTFTECEPQKVTSKISSYMKKRYSELVIK